MILFPLLSLAACVVTAIVFFGPGVIIYVSDAQEPVLIVFGAITLYLLVVVTLFFNTALAATASRALAGEPATTLEGLDAARDRLGPIFEWALVQTTIGVALAALEGLMSDSIVGRLIAGAAGVAWGVATFFVVPVIALEGLTPRAAARHSVALVRERWGEGAAGTVGVSAPIALIALPVLLLLGGSGLALADSSPPLAGVLLGLAGVAFVTAMVVGSTLTAVFRVALYRYATTGEPPEEFASVDLASTFRPRSKGRVVRDWPHE